MSASKSFARARAADLSEQAAEHFNNPETAGKLWAPDTDRSREALTIGNTVGFQFSSLTEAFPDVDPLEFPAGNMVLFQIRQTLSRTAGGVILDTETRKTEYYNTQVAKVIRIGPLAFHNRNTNEEWPEGAWAKIGEFVRIPKYQGSRFTRPYNRPDFEIDAATGRRKEIWTEDEVHFALLKDLAIESIIPDPLLIRAFI